MTCVDLHIHPHCPPFVNTLKTNSELGVGFSYFDDLILVSFYSELGIVAGI